MEDWKRILAKSIVKPRELAQRLNVDEKEIESIVGDYPMRITPAVLSTIKAKGDAIWKQVVPDAAELVDIDADDDPLEEDLMSPVPHLVHRYPDRVLLMVTNQCPIYCRFCTRKRLVGKPGFLKKGELDRALAYLREHTEVRDVILSGGDPLLLPDPLLERILKALRTIPHLELIRLGSRVPGSLPERITPKLCEIVKRYHPIYMNLHFNHPDELTPEVKAACGMLADAGVPLGAQTVLLKGVNDDPEVMKQLVHQLLLARVKPYYLYQADLTKGTNHFRTTVETGLNIIRALQGHTSGMGVPHFVIDAPGGGGKIPLLPGDYLVHMDDEGAVLRNYEQKTFHYPQPKNGTRRELPMVGAGPGMGGCIERLRWRVGRAVKTRARREGILPYQSIRDLIARQVIRAEHPVEDRQVQPASLDLRLGRKAYRLISSFLPELSEITSRLNVLDFYQSDLVMYEMDLTEGAILEKGHVYLVPLLESLHLPKALRARANPKSTTGRLDVFTRVVTDLNAGFDEVRAGYQGPLYLEIVPRSFTIKVKTGYSLNQIRFIQGDATVPDDHLRRIHRSQSLLYHNGPAAKPLDQQDVRTDRGLFLRIDLKGQERGERPVIGYRAKKNSHIIDWSKIGYYAALDFWEPLIRHRQDSLLLEPEEFYILASKERIRVPAGFAAEMVAYEAACGELRTHYAGFFDPGFGYGQGDLHGTQVVLEVRPHDVPFLIHDGQTFFKVVYDYMQATPAQVYGAALGSSYQRQGLTLSKHFKA